MKLTHDEFMRAIEHAPTVGFVADGLIGWELDDGRRYCAQCVKRAITRGFGDFLTSEGAQACMTVNQMLPFICGACEIEWRPGG